jgi:transcriptional regulator with XRE-family HTH domain
MTLRAEESTTCSVRIKKLRERLHLTQGHLAELLGVTQAVVSRWESGSAAPPTLFWQRILEAEEHGRYALRRPEPDVLEVAEPTTAAPNFTASPDVVRVIAEAHRLGYGHLFNPAFATELALIEPLPHQRIAVYDHLLKLPRIRFLMADDPAPAKRS